MKTAGARWGSWAGVGVPDGAIRKVAHVINEFVAKSIDAVRTAFGRSAPGTVESGLMLHARLAGQVLATEWKGFDHDGRSVAEQRHWHVDLVIVVVDNVRCSIHEIRALIRIPQPDGHRVLPKAKIGNNDIVGPHW